MSAPIKEFQTCDSENYRELLTISSQSNDAYCEKFDIAFETFVGLKRGYFPWHACFNRIVYLKEQIDAGYDGWVFYIDADAYVFDHSFDIRALLKSFDGDFLFSPGGLTGEKWDVNDGVFLINLGSDAGKELALAWYEDFMSTSEDALRAASDWQMVPSDQPRLHKILRNSPHLLERLAMVPREVFNHEKASFVRQVLRSNASTMEERIAKLREGVAEALSGTPSKPAAPTTEEVKPMLQNPEQYGQAYDTEFRRVLRQYAGEATTFLEWGAGYTTRMTIEHIGDRPVDLFLTIDHNKSYLDKVVEEYTDCAYLQSKAMSLEGPCVDDRDTGLNYATFPFTAGRTFDFIFIDGRRRMECAMMALALSNPDSIIVIHDYRRTRYQPLLAFYRIIEDGPQFRVVAPRMTIFPAVQEMTPFVRQAMSAGLVPAMQEQKVFA